MVLKEHVEEAGVITFEFWIWKYESKDWGRHERLTNWRDTCHTI